MFAQPAVQKPTERFAPGQVILGGELDFAELVLAFTEDQGVDVVIDILGGDFRNAAPDFV